MTTPTQASEERPWRVVSVPFTDVTTDVQITTIPCRVLSYNLQEATGAGAATVDIYDGTSTGGIRLRRVNLATSESKDDDFDPPYVPALGGLWVDVTAGQVSGTVTIAYAE